MPQPIQLRHTVSPTNTPTSADGTTAHLIAGEPAFAIAPAGVTKLWVGDATGNRLLLSTVDADAPLATAAYAKLNGATFTGAVLWATTPTLGTHLTNKDYVDQAVATGQLYQGTYNAGGNVPDLTVSGNRPTVNGAYLVVSHAGTIPAGVPGVAGQTVNPGDHLVWNTGTNDFSIIPAGGMTQADADLRYLQLAGGTMAGTITMAAAYTPTPATQQVATMNALTTATTGMLTTVNVDGTSIGGTGASGAGNALHLVAVDGGTF